MKFYRLLAAKIFTFLFLFCSFCACAQTQQDSLFNQQAINNVLAFYKSSVKENLYLYNGGEYAYTGHSVNSFPFFKSEKMLPGSVYYDNNLYTDVLMHYDLTSDELVIFDYTKNYPIQLIKDKVRYFIIDSSKFINSGVNDVASLNAQAGFYEELYHGKTIVFAKKKKVIETRNTAEGFVDTYKQYDDYFIYKDENIYKVTNEKSLLNVLKNKSVLKKFIADSNISFKKNFEAALIATTKHFDEIKN